MSLDRSGLLEALLLMKDVLKCAITNSGALSVMMDGEIMMLTWLADRQDSPDSVGYMILCSLTVVQSTNIVINAYRCSSS